MGLGASIHQSLTFFQRQHSETKSAKMVSKCYKKRGRRLSARPPVRPSPGRQMKFGFRVAGAGVKGCLC